MGTAQGKDSTNMSEPQAAHTGANASLDHSKRGHDECSRGVETLLMVRGMS